MLEAGDPLPRSGHIRGYNPPLSRRSRSCDPLAVLALRERSGALSPPAAGRILAAVPPVCFTFSDRPRCVSEDLVLKAASRPGWPGDAETQLIELRAALVAALPMEM